MWWRRRSLGEKTVETTEHTEVFVRWMLAMALMGVGAARAGGENSAWVREAGGKLTYKTTERGDRVMDFSYAGYGGGGVGIPEVPSVMTVAPSGKEDAPAIQAAIDAVSKRPLDKPGFRGAVTLQAGAYFCGSALEIQASGVVLRGAGDGENGTRIQMTGKAHGFLNIGPGTNAGRRRESVVELVGAADAITDAYVPCGTQSVSVADASVFKPGDAVVIARPITTAWVHFMQMDELVRNGKPETWLQGGTITMRRLVTAVSGHRVTFDVPLSDDIDAAYLQKDPATVQKYTANGRLSHVGVEGMSVSAPAIQIHMQTSPEMAAQREKKADGDDDAAPPPTRAFGGIHLDGVTDAWVRDFHITDTVGVLDFGPDSSRITAQDIVARHSVASVGAAKPADLVVQGSQVLIQRCKDTGDNVFYFVTQARVTGPNVLRDCEFVGNGHIAPHQRWMTGLLVENCKVPNGGIDFMDRGVMGSGHGWTTGWSVAWNCEAKSYQIDGPPGVMNWAIGCTGAVEASKEPGSGRLVGTGVWEARGARVAPLSLYEAQLKERVGADGTR